MKIKSEILAPAGNISALKAGVNAGANAVYIGYGKLNARRNAVNFTHEELLEAVSYCKARDVLVYLTLNTIVYDKELELAKETIELVANAGVDAIIVQDLGIAKLCKDICPSMPLHASTQLSIHNVSGAKLMKDLGFTRVVLSRELSKKEIIDITHSVDIETEVFVHGAMCMSVSGQCYFSSMIGERSGNRGTCAQTCRLPFSSCENKQKDEYILSLKDLSIIDRLSELEDMGVSSFKIEGRMKRPEYVYSSVQACVKSLSGEYVDFSALQAIFSRDGFSSGYYDNKLNLSMFGTRKKDDITDGNKIMSSITNQLDKENPIISIDFSLYAHIDKSISLTATDGTYTVSTQGQLPQIAEKKPTDLQAVEKSLSKLGGTYFKLGNISVDMDNNIMIPISQLNNLRRQCLADLDKLRSKLTPRNICNVDIGKFEKIHSAKKWSLRGVFHNPAIISDSIVDSLEYIIVPLDKLNLIDTLDKHKHKIIGLMPRLTFGNDIPILTTLLDNAKNLGINKVSTSSIGCIHLAQSLGFKVFGDFGLNITNGISFSELQDLNVENITLSFELSMPRARDISLSNNGVGIISYGKLPMMLNRNCPLKANTGCKNCNDDNRFIIDRKNQKYTIRCINKQHVEILNNIPLYIGDKVNDLDYFDFHTLVFTDESQIECIDIIDSFKNGQSISNITRGLYYRNVL